MKKELEILGNFIGDLDCLLQDGIVINQVDKSYALFLFNKGIELIKDMSFINSDGQLVEIPVKDTGD